jgi:hypothetical protein
MEWKIKKGWAYESSKDCLLEKSGPKLPYFEGKKFEIAGLKP